MAEARQQWADQPFAMIETPGFTKDLSSPVVKVATEMALSHNTFFRGINSIYLQAPHISLPADISDFLVYCQSWFEIVSHHHDKEENFLFRAIEKFTGDPKIMCANIEGHVAFHDGLEKFGKYAYETKAETYDSGKLKSIVDGFAAPFEKHLREEIESLLALEKYDGQELLKAYGEMEHAIVSTADKYRLFPQTLGARDDTYENGMHVWPPIPFFVPYVVHYYFERRHAGAWRFSPSDTWGRPRKLAFLGN